jgi:hypothetical protein
VSFWISILGLELFFRCCGQGCEFLVMGLNQELDCDFLGGKFVYLISVLLCWFGI